MNLMHSSSMMSFTAAVLLLSLFIDNGVSSFVTDVPSPRWYSRFMHQPQHSDLQLNHKALPQSCLHKVGLQRPRSCLLAHTEHVKQDQERLNLTEEEVQQSFDYLASLIQIQLENRKAAQSADSNEAASASSENTALSNNPAVSLAKHRFTDLTTTESSQILLENMFSLSPPPSTRLIKYAILSLQSLLIHAAQIGVKGSEEHQTKLVRHLFRRYDPPKSVKGTWVSPYTAEDIRRLKFYRDVELGKGVLAALKRRRTSVGAYELLIEMGVWGRNEEITLLRSGFPVRFLEDEMNCSMEAERNTHDPDAILGIRQDLRHQKVYTIDSPSTKDIDDGISVEAITDPSNNKQKLRYWIHIADVDRWAPRGSELLKVAERRGTSLYLPGITLDMFPENMASDTMSLTSNTDKYALSLGVQLNSDGSINASSIILTSSLIHVNYRLTYDQVDEMLDEGVGYTEEWEVGALLAAATKRREHRVQRGSSEGFIPCPIPKGFVTVDKDGQDGGYNIDVRIETTHNSGLNMTVGGVDGGVEHYDPYASPVSSSQLIVTEMMILAGEALGKWHQLQPIEKVDSSDETILLPNELKLPYRRQPSPDYKTRVQESKQADYLIGMNKMYPHAWYCRRFFKPVQVSEEIGPHFGMGLDCYVQWSSPIRRLTDLQVHAAIKRYLRRKQANKMLLNNKEIPAGVKSIDLGYDLSHLDKQNLGSGLNPVDPIDYKSGLGMIFAARPIQTSSSNFWLFEYIRQKVQMSESEVMFESIVLGCVDHDRFQYAIYVYELGFEHRYLSENGKLEEGKRLWLKVASVNPRLELLTFSLASKSGGVHHAQTKSISAM